MQSLHGEAVTWSEECNYSALLYSLDTAVASSVSVPASVWKPVVHARGSVTALRGLQQMFRVL